MKTRIFIFFLFLLMQLQLCIAQQSKTVLPKLENYTKGELELKTTAFGEKNPITIGKITADGTIHLKWPDVDHTKLNDNDYWTKSLKSFTGGNFCRDPKAVIEDENATLVENQFLYLYKYDQIVGSIIPSTQKNKEHNKNQLGSTINWVYSYNDTSANANCSEKKEWEDLYSFNETTTYNLKFKKGWNMVVYTLSAIEEWEENAQKRSLPKTKIVQTIDEIPSNMYWQLKYWANDAYLEIEHQLPKLAPITSAQYKNWMPKKLGNLKRVSSEIGKKLERITSINNVNMIYEKGSKKIDVTILDCGGSKESAQDYTMMLGMVSREWKDDKDTGYNSSSKMDDVAVMTEYNSEENTTKLYFNSNERFSIQATGSNMKPEELWKYLKELNLKSLK